MNCPEFFERLPWYSNGTLDPRERDDIEAHLAGCADCRRELDELRRAAEIYRAELPAQALIDHVLGTRESGLDPALVTRLIETTPRYREEVALLRASLADSALDARSEGGKVLPGRFGRKVEVPRWLPIAASIAGLLLPALLIWNQALRSDLTATVAERRQTEQNREIEHRAALERIEEQLRQAREQAEGNAQAVAERERLRAELERLQAGGPVQVAESRLPSVLAGQAQLNPKSALEGVVRGTEAKLPSLVRRPGPQAVPVRLDRLAKDFPAIEGFRFRLRDDRDRTELRPETVSREAGSAVVFIESSRYPAGALTLEILGVSAGAEPELVGTVELTLVDPR